MTGVAMEIWGYDGAKSPKFPLDGDLDVALAAYCKARWPVGTRKAIEREWDLSVDEAKAAAEGRASKRIINKIWTHGRGGWAVALPVLAGVIGQPVQAFFEDQIKQAAIQAEKAKQHEELARAAYRRLAGRSDRNGDARDGSPTARETRGLTRNVGPKEARRSAG